MPADDRLAALLVDAGAEGRILLREAVAAPSTCWPGASASLALIESEMTGSGTCIDVIATFERAVGERVARGAVDAEQRDDVAGARRRSMSSISSECMRTRRPTLCFLPVRVLTIVVALAERALVDAHVGELAVAAVLELERERDERLLSGRRARPSLLVRCSRSSAMFSTSRGLGQVASRRRRAAAGRPCSCRPSR